MVENRIGEILRQIGEYHESITHHEKALDIFESKGDQAEICRTCYLIGNAYNWANELDSAYNFLNRSLTIAEDLGVRELQVKPAGSLAILYTKLREYQKALDHFFTAIDLVDQTSGNSLLKSDLLRNLGNLYIETNDFGKADEALRESLDLVKDTGVREPLAAVYKSLAELNELQGKHTDALRYYKKHVTTINEIIDKEADTRSRGLQLKYDFEELKKKRDLAERSVELKDQFISNLSHEIRTPLNGVLGMANLLADTNPSPEQLEYINTIKLSANNLIAIIDDLLDYSNIQAGKVKFRNREFIIRDILTQIIQLFKARADEKRIQLSCTFDEDLPEILIGDAVRLRQILLNLTSNALKFTDTGSVNLDVRIISNEDKDIRLLFKVTDTGRGISGDQLETIFESFTKIIDHDSKELIGGTGLGLAIVKQLTELQGGIISVSSSPGNGSVFKVELPYRLKETLPKRIRSGGSERRPSIDQKDLTQVQVLLVEDNKVNQFLAQKLLRKMGFEVSIAGSGKEALTILAEDGACDVILMDVQMPEMNGYELTQVIRKNPDTAIANIPIIALTAYASESEKEKAMQAGMSEYVTKPYSPDDLLTVILKVTAKDKGDISEHDEKGDAGVNEGSVRQATDHLLEMFGGSRSDVLSLLQMLSAQIPQMIKEIEDHILRSNWPATFQASHKLKSSISLLKISHLSNIIAEIEEYSRDQSETGKILPLFKKLRSLCDSTVSNLKSEIIRLKKE
jgi:signal transduction histidine kinase/DNA-binding response OmpR family regulator